MRNTKQTSSVKCMWRMNWRCITLFYQVNVSSFLYRPFLTVAGYSYSSIFSGDFEVTISGRLYKFVKSKPIMYTGWKSLYIFFDELLNIMIEVADKHALRKS